MPEFTAPDSSPARLRLFGLLIGIGTYQRVRPLRGPAHDLRVVEEYLRNLPDVEPNLLVLADEAATKSAIADAFTNHLTKAGPGDTVFVYFSGHGAQEAADATVWATETDSQLECLVCHDRGAVFPHEFLLADKELRYLLGPVAATGAHVVTLFDCCHAGDNTRNFAWLQASLDGQETPQDVRERRLTQAAPQRPWSGFVFSEKLSETDLKTAGLDDLMPSAAHVQLAACESDESAVEVAGEGIFTKNLLAVLRASGGNLSYGALHNRVRQYMRFGYEQRPRVAALGEGAEARMNATFLNRPGSATAPAAEATFNPTQGWLLDVGALHGVGQTTKTIELLDGETRYPVGVALVGADYTVLDVPADTKAALQPEKSYPALVEGLLTRKIRLYLTNDGAGADQTIGLLTALAERAGGFFDLEETEAAADYTLRLRHGAYLLTRPADPFRPLVRPVPADAPDTLADVADALRHLARWHYLRDLANPDVTTPPFALALGVDGAAPVPVGNEPVDVAFGDTPPHIVTLDVALTNPTDRPAYCTALYLSRDFMAATALLPTNTRLEPGQTIHLGLPDRKNLAGRLSTVKFRLEEVVRQYNWPAVTEHFQFILTADPLSESTLAFLTLDALPSPPTLQDRQTELATRSALWDEEEPAAAFPTWWTQRVSVRMRNPKFNQIPAAELRERLAPVTEDAPTTFATDLLADCTLGLFYDLKPDANGLPVPVLKPEIEVERGLWSDFKTAVTNGLTTRMRLREYQQNLLRYPRRTRLVAGGDGWFQYPMLLKDVVDLLGRVYNIRAFAAPDETLVELAQNPALFTTIADVDPDFVLLSGGANDLFGDDFPNFLAQNPDPAQPSPQRYLGPAFAPALDAVLTACGNVLRQIKVGYPLVRVLVHGYDYPATGEVSGKPNRLAEVMTAAGITDPAERDALARYVVDEFNRRLEALVGQYPNASYLDLRGAMRGRERPDEFWFDALVPNDKGFLKIATRFDDRIAALQKSSPSAPVS